MYLLEEMDTIIWIYIIGHRTDMMNKKSDYCLTFSYSRCLLQKSWTIRSYWHGIEVRSKWWMLMDTKTMKSRREYVLSQVIHSYYKAMELSMNKASCIIHKWQLNYEVWWSVYLIWVTVLFSMETISVLSSQLSCYHYKKKTQMVG